MTTTYLYHIEEASPKDASLLSHIAYLSKKHWGYPEAWMQLWQADLTVTEAMLQKHHACKAIYQGETAGFALITQAEEGYEIEHCFVLPAYIGKGCGTTLLRHLLSLPQYEAALFQVQSDPNAVAFYEKFGFKTIAQVPSQPKGRTLPLMKRPVHG